MKRTEYDFWNNFGLKLLKGRNWIFLSLEILFSANVGNNQVSTGKILKITRDLNGMVSHTSLNTPKFDFVSRLNLKHWLLSSNN